MAQTAVPIPKGLVRPSCEIRLQHRISTDGQLRRSQPKKHSALCDSPNGWWADRDHSRYQILFRHVMGNTTWKDYINLIIKQQNTRIAIGSIWPTNIGIFKGQKNIHQLYVLYYIYVCVRVGTCTLLFTHLWRTSAAESRASGNIGMKSTKRSKTQHYTVNMSSSSPHSSWLLWLVNHYFNTMVPCHASQKIW